MTFPPNANRLPSPLRRVAGSRAAALFALAAGIGGCPSPTQPTDTGSDTGTGTDTAPTDATGTDIIAADNGPSDGMGSDTSSNDGAATDGTSAICNLAACQNDLAVTCDGTYHLSCTSFGGHCDAFQTAADGAWQWCNCGTIAEGSARCIDNQTGIACIGGEGVPGVCPIGTTCIVDATSPQGGCICDNVRDGVCPDPQCTSDPDCASCTPSCGSRVCGDNGCGGSCGACPMGQACTSGGQCQTTCVANCIGHQCGPDGCGGSCGSCPTNLACDARGLCSPTCVANCSGRVCGTDGCGGTCGSCGTGMVCDGTGQCATQCTPNCAGRTCGSDGCSGSCGTCTTGTCGTNGQCSCTPNCTGRMCGFDGCSGNCGSCQTGYECATDGSRCQCGFFDLNTYVFDGSSIDWTAVSVVHIFVQQLGALNGTTMPTDFTLTMSSPMHSFRTYGCEPDVQITRDYYMANTGAMCTLGPQEVRQTPPQCTSSPGGILSCSMTIAIPSATATSGSCTAPML